MKRFLGILLVLLMVILLPVSTFSVSAAADTHEAESNILYELGLFRGVGTDADGSPRYALDEVTTRGHAIVMLIRFLGLERVAEASGHSHPFNDVPTWCSPHVGYAYSNSFTNGMSDYSFGTNLATEANMYLTFILRALGYKDTGDNADFSYSNAVAFANTIGLANETHAGDFLRGDMVAVSYAALSLTINNSETTLIQSLVNSGAVNAQKAIDSGFAVEAPEPGEEVPIPVRSNTGISSGSYTAKLEDILTVFPTAVRVAVSVMAVDEDSFIEQLSSSMYSEKEILFLRSINVNDETPVAPEFLNDEIHINAFSSFSVPGSESVYRYYEYICVTDSSYNILGTFCNWEQDITEDYVVFLRGGSGVDGGRLFRDVKIRLNSVMLDYNGAELTIADEGYDPEATYWIGASQSYVYPAYLDGAPLSQDHYACVQGISPFDESDDEAIYRQIYEIMFDVLFLNESAATEDGSPPESGCFSENGLRQAYSPTQGGFKDHYGIRLPDTCSLTVFVVVFDRNGTVLGYAIIPPNS